MDLQEKGVHLVISVAAELKVKMDPRVLVDHLVRSETKVYLDQPALKERRVIWVRGVLSVLQVLQVTKVHVAPREFKAFQELRDPRVHKVPKVKRVTLDLQVRRVKMVHM